MKYPAIETHIIELLRTGPMRQVDIVDAFALDQYLIVGATVRDMARRGLIAREKSGSTYIVRLKEGG